MTDHPLRESVNVPGCEPLYPNYSSCVIAKPGRFVFVSGQVAVDEDGNNVGVGDVAAQADFVLEKIRKILEYNGRRWRTWFRIGFMLPTVSSIRWCYPYGSNTSPRMDPPVRLWRLPRCGFLNGSSKSKWSR